MIAVANNCETYRHALNETYFMDWNMCIRTLRSPDAASLTPSRASLSPNNQAKEMVWSSLRECRPRAHWLQLFQEGWRPFQPPKAGMTLRSWGDAEDTGFKSRISIFSATLSSKAPAPQCQSYATPQNDNIERISKFVFSFSLSWRGVPWSWWYI